MLEVDVVALRVDARDVVHAASPAGAEVGAVLPGAVGAEPAVVGQQNRVDAPQPVPVAGLLVGETLRPGEDVSSHRGKIVALKGRTPVVDAHLARDETVVLLLPVEVVERFDEGEGAGGVASEHRDEAAPPDENGVCKFRVDEIPRESASGQGLVKLAGEHPPCGFVAGDGVVVPRQKRTRGGGQKRLQRRWRSLIPRLFAECVLCDERGEGVRLEVRPGVSSLRGCRAEIENGFGDACLDGEGLASLAHLDFDHRSDGERRVDDAFAPDPVGGGADAIATLRPPAVEQNGQAHGRVAAFPSGSTCRLVFLCGFLIHFPVSRCGFYEAGVWSDRAG